jgi:hypothetical protein
MSCHDDPTVPAAHEQKGTSGAGKGEQGHRG